MPDLTGKKQNIAILSFNTLGAPFIAPNVSLRYKKIAETINASQIDIVCLQEVTTYYHLYLLKRHLNNYPNAYYKKFIYGPKGGLVTFSKQPVESIEYKSFSKLGDFKNKSFYSKIFRNGILIFKLKKAPLTILNTHLITDFEFDWSEKNPYFQSVRAQVEEAIQIVNEMAAEGNAVIVVGDFNMAKNSMLYERFIKSTNSNDIFREYSHPTYYRDRLNYLFKGKKSDRIDYIFLKNGRQKIDVISTSHFFDKEVPLSNRKKSYLSDHIGLKVNLSLQTK